ncbi:hypothetical protein Ocin01_08306 [Orchesella cincta]|uniref:Uncharacterized protein n=1 Tax=Orchesella cincta TaxID=48709 RepID=A0A1D2MZF7_ORCCI|nr:hypothetical protein Ocin01_08306 [Orchesella cincta]
MAAQKTSSSEKVFVFPEFDYAESPKNYNEATYPSQEISHREWESACTQTPACLGISDLEKVKCVRKCMSPSCYHDIYAFDELEEGEIDIRFQSFKGCFASRITRKHFTGGSSEYDEAIPLLPS